MELPAVKQRVSLWATLYTDEDTPPEGAWEDAGSTDVTILARDLDEGIWTVWDHGAKQIKMVCFDENANWYWLEAAPEVTDDQA